MADDWIEAAELRWQDGNAALLGRSRAASLGQVWVISEGQFGLATANAAPGVRVLDGPVEMRARRLGRGVMHDIPLRTLASDDPLSSVMGGGVAMATWEGDPREVAMSLSGGFAVRSQVDGEWQPVQLPMPLGAVRPTFTRLRALWTPDRILLAWACRLDRQNPDGSYRTGLVTLGLLSWDGQRFRTVALPPIDEEGFVQELAIGQWRGEPVLLSAGRSVDLHLTGSRARSLSICQERSYAAVVAGDDQDRLLIAWIDNRDARSGGLAARIPPLPANRAVFSRMLLPGGTLTAESRLSPDDRVASHLAAIPTPHGIVCAWTQSMLDAAQPTRPARNGPQTLHAATW